MAYKIDIVPVLRYIVSMDCLIFYLLGMSASLHVAKGEVCYVGQSSLGKRNTLKWAVSNSDFCHCTSLTKKGRNGDVLVSDDVNRIREMFHCKLQATWNYANEWSPCNASCGGGTQNRTQYCVNSDNITADGQCSGNAETETRKCNTEKCPSWKYMNEWSPCNASCGGGTQIRTQSCVNSDNNTADGQCLGNAETEMRHCNIDQCPTWKYVNEWSPCNAKCGGGTQTRTQSCVNSNQAAGDEQCSGVAQTETKDCNTDQCHAKCLAGWAIKGYRGPDTGSWTMVAPDKVITCDGVVSQWRYQAEAPYRFRAIIWRQVTGETDTKFQIVGINDIPAGSVDTEVTFQVPASDRIAVKTGDVIGWSSEMGVLSYTSIRNSGGTLVRWISGSLHLSLQVNQAHNIDASGIRDYAIEATVQ